MSKLSTGKYEKYGISYTTFTLTDNEYSFTVTPEKGGMATSFKKGEEEYLWLRDHNFESFDRPRCGVPILFPCCGQPDGGVHHFNGKDYPIENHGFADLLPWEVEETTDSRIVLKLLPNGLTKFVYPFDFKVMMEYSLSGNCASLKMTVENIGNDVLPYSIGFHPYFVASKLDNVSFDIQAETFSDNNKGVQPKLTGEVTLPHSTGDASTRFLTGVKSPMVLKDCGNNHKVTVNFDSSFTNAILWQQEAESFVCMEPWNGWQNSLNEEGKFETLNPGESKQFNWSITID